MIQTSLNPLTSTETIHKGGYIGLMLLMLLTCGCGKRRFQNELSPMHIHVAGTRVSLVPPRGFVPSSSFAGFEQPETGSSIVVSEMASPYVSIAKGFTKRSLNTQGMEILKDELLKIGEDDGLFLTVNQSANGILYGKFSLVFGDQGHTVIINASYPKNVEEALAEDLQNALLSVVYEDKMKLDPLASVPYTINVEGTTLDLVSYLTNSLTFTRGGAFPASDADKTTLIITQSIGQVIVEDKESYAKDRLQKQSTIANISVDTIVEILIDGLPGYEIVAYGTGASTRTPMLLYQMILFEEAKYYLIVGTASGHFEMNLQQFKQASHTFRRKDR